MSKIYQKLFSKEKTDSVTKVISKSARKGISEFFSCVISHIFSPVIPEGCSRGSYPCEIQKWLGLQTEIFGGGAGERQQRLWAETFGRDGVYLKQLRPGGFTLIELLVVVLIIGILAAAALPQYRTAVAKSRFAALIPVVRSLSEAQEVYYLENGEYAISFEKLSVIPPCPGASGGAVCCNQMCYQLYQDAQRGSVFASHSLYPALEYLHSAAYSDDGSKQWCIVSLKKSAADVELARRVCKSYGPLSQTKGNYEWYGF